VPAVAVELGVFPVQEAPVTKRSGSLSGSMSPRLRIPPGLRGRNSRLVDEAVGVFWYSMVKRLDPS